MNLTAALPIAVGVTVTSGLLLWQNAHPATPVVPRGGDAVERVPVTLADIAERVSRTYLDAESVIIEARVVGRDATIEYRYEGTPTAFRTVAFHDGKVYGAFSFDRGRVEELVPDHCARLVLCYDSEYDDQIPRLVHPRPLDCQYGGAFGLLIGEKSTMLPGLAQRIERGEHRGMVEVNGRQCHEVAFEKTLLNSSDQPVLIRHIYRIDAATHVVAQWDTHQGDIVRQRYFPNVALGQTPPTDWSILPHVESLVGSLASNDGGIPTTPR